jgi:hypothetical protein
LFIAAKNELVSSDACAKPQMASGMRFLEAHQRPSSSATITPNDFAYAKKNQKEKEI